jgi:hypothetical protein
MNQAAARVRRALAIIKRGVDYGDSPLTPSRTITKAEHDEVVRELEYALDKLQS